MNPLRILLVEDHALVREALKSLINNQPGMSVVGEAGDGIAALQLAPRLQPDIVVMDVSMPRLNGAQATRELKRAHPNVHVIALTQYQEKSFVRELFDAGATAYVLKRSASEQLIQAIRTVAAGGIFFDPLISEQVATGFVRTSAAPSLDIALSAREEQVLRLIAGGYTNKEIAHRLDLGVKSIETYKARAMEKLGLNSRAELVRYASLHGWLENL